MAPPVAPRAGARIETDYRGVASGTAVSPPVRGRGLKHVATFTVAGGSTAVAPRAGARIETGSLRLILRREASPPVRGRGLKRTDAVAVRHAAGSPPVRGRGLKRGSASP